MGYLINNERTVYSISGEEPLYVYSQTDKFLMEVSKVQTPKEERRTGFVDGFKNIVGEKFNLDRISDEEEIQAVTNNPQSLIVNMQLGENCLIAGRDEEGSVDGGFLISTFPDSSTGKYYGPTQSGLPNFVVNFFTKKFGETDVNVLREQLVQSEGENLPAMQDIQVTDLAQDGATLPPFNIDINQGMEQ